MSEVSLQLLWSTRSSELNIFALHLEIFLYKDYGMILKKILSG